MQIRAIFFFLLLSQIGLAQVSISGQVLNANEESVPGVNIWIDGTYDGTTSDKEGKFDFTTHKSDSLTLVLSCIGYKTLHLNLDNGVEHLQIILSELVNELSAVQITAGSIEVSDKANSVVMKPIDILTTAGAMGDITGALATLPGTSTVGNDGRLFVRGGDANETAIFFDGLRVGNAYGTTAANLPTRNRFNPTLFKGTFFSTGGYSAEYGDALSSVLALQSIDKPIRNQTDISLMSVGASVSSTFVGKKQSISLEAAGLNLAPYQELVKQNFDWEKAPQSYSGQAVYRNQVSKKGMLKAFVQASESDMVLWRPLPGNEGRGVRTAIRNQFLFGNTSFNSLIGSSLRTEGGVSYSHNTDWISLDSSDFKQEHSVLHVKEKLTHYALDNLKFRYGAEVFLREFKEADLYLKKERSVDELRSAAFSEVEWYVSNKFTLRGGARVNLNNTPRQFSMQPRLAAAYELYSGGSVSFAAGMFSQPQNDVYRLTDYSITDVKANHLQLSFQHQEDGRTFRAEFYNKDYKDIGVWEGGNARAIGTGVARGFDIFFRDRNSLKNLDYWLTYSFVDSRRRFGSFQSSVQPDFAPTHNFSIVGKYWIENWKSQLGASFVMNSGYAYHDPNLEGEMQGMSPNYASLSINWSYLIRQNLILHVACNNVLGRQNVFGYTYSAQADEQGQFASIPLGQPADRFIFAGLFWTISSDKQANQLNNL